ncbi:MAG: 50S ribosomal protein L13 [Candidatus Shikimatogenerans bostrichidophilus]|nr:MAG: 50S ribosomal protein L13 [Candidatus Shikimatogenerans bostrichidophilus]
MIYFNLKTKFFFQIKKKNYLINAKNKILGRLSSNIIKLLINKNNSIYTPNYNNINKVIIINANKIKYKKNKIYKKYTGYIGNIKKKKAENLFKNNPSILLRLSINRMLPKNLLGKYAKKNIFIYNNNKYNKNITNLIKYKI